MIPPNKANHASFLELLPTGDLLIAWFSGTKEGQNDVSIYIARLPLGTDQWSNASLVSRWDGYSNQNPVLFYDPTTKILNLWHSQQPAGEGETDAKVWHLQSMDGQGMNWTKPKDLLTTSGSFDRNRVILSLDGGLILPIYYAGEWLLQLIIHYTSIFTINFMCTWQAVHIILYCRKTKCVVSTRVWVSIFLSQKWPTTRV